ncbi:MAG: hypothetical protein GY733_21620 [bacterium]|nr:hypothetical protein [bacterium]
MLKQRRTCGAGDAGPVAWLTTGIAVALALATAAPAEEILVDGIAAQVGDQVVLASELEEIARPVIARMRAAGVPDDEVLRVRKDALERLIESKLIDAIVVRLELGATKVEIDNAIASIAKDTGLTLGQLAESVAGHGMSFEDYRIKIKSELERNKVMSSMVRSKVQVQEAEITALYDKRYGEQPSGGEEVHLRHIMVTFDPKSAMARSTACQTVAAARQRIVSGQASFAEVARQTSDANPSTGGELGWIHLNDLAGWMAPELLTMNQGNPISRVIDMPFGCNLLELVDRRVFQPLSLEQARPQLEQELFMAKTDEEYTRWVATMRERTYIERKGIYAASSVAEASANTQ